MDFRDLAKDVVCNIIATALAMTAAAVRGMLPFRPDWNERIEELAARFRAVSDGDYKAPEQEAQPADDGAVQVPTDEFRRLISAYDHLWQFTQQLRTEGLGLDDELCERIESEWTVTTLLSYLRNADQALQDHAAGAVEAAGALMSSANNDDGSPAAGA